MYVFGEIDNSSTTIETNLVNFTQNLTTASAGINSIKITSGSTNNKYWQSLNVLFYTSGSPSFTNESQMTRTTSDFSYSNRKQTQYLTKFHGYPNIQVIQIPQQYYGEKIKEGSFQFTDLKISSSVDSTIKPIIKDDGKGNLYSTNAYHSQSAGELSSADNYVGNIFYEHGIAVITETGSWSGSKNYSDMGTNYKIKLDSSSPITTYEYNLNLLPQEYNDSTNYTLRSPISGSLKLSTRFLAREFTGSNFQPYITTINLYQDGNYDTPVITAKLPKPIRKSDKISTRFKIKLDI